MPHALLQKKENTITGYKASATQSFAFISPQAPTPQRDPLISQDAATSLAKYVTTSPKKKCAPPRNGQQSSFGFEKLPLELKVIIFQLLDTQSQFSFLSASQQLWHSQVELFSFSPKWKTVEALHPKIAQKYGHHALSPLSLYRCLTKRHHLSHPTQYTPVWQTKQLRSLSAENGQHPIVIDAQWLYAAATVGNTDLCLWLLNHEELGSYYFKAFEIACTHKNTQTALELFEWLYRHATPQTFFADYRHTLLKLAIQATADKIVPLLLNQFEIIRDALQKQLESITGIDDQQIPLLLKPNLDTLTTLFLVSRKTFFSSEYWANLLNDFANQMNKEERLHFIDEILKKQEGLNAQYTGLTLTGMLLELQDTEAFRNIDIRGKLGCSFAALHECQDQLLQRDILDGNSERVQYSIQKYGINFNMAGILQIFDIHLASKNTALSIEAPLYYLLTLLGSDTHQWIKAEQTQRIEAEQTQTLILKASQTGYTRIITYLAEQSPYITQINLMPAIQKAIQRNDQTGVEIITILSPYVSELLHQIMDAAITQDNWGVVHQLLSPTQSLDTLMQTALQGNKFHIVDGLHAHTSTIPTYQHFDWKSSFNAFINRDATGIQWEKKHICHYFMMWIKQGVVEQPLVILDAVFTKFQHEAQHPWMSNLILTLLNTLHSSLPNEALSKYRDAVCQAIQERGDINLLHNLLLKNLNSNKPIDLFGSFDNQTVVYNTLKVSCQNLPEKDFKKHHDVVLEQLCQFIQRNQIDDRDILSATLKLATQLERFDIAYIMINLKHQYGVLAPSDQYLIQDHFELSQSAHTWLNQMFPPPEYSRNERPLMGLSH